MQRSCYSVQEERITQLFPFLEKRFPLMHVPKSPPAPNPGLPFPKKNPRLCRDPSLNALSAIAMVTPSLPQRGRQPKEASPLTPNFDLFFQMHVYSHALRGEGRQTPSARGSITIQFACFQHSQIPPKKPRKTTTGSGNYYVCCGPF